jgi:hypothetical protein
MDTNLKTHPRRALSSITQRMRRKSMNSKKLPSKAYVNFVKKSLEIK